MFPFSSPYYKYHIPLSNEPEANFNKLKIKTSYKLTQVEIKIEKDTKDMATGSHNIRPIPILVQDCNKEREKGGERNGGRGMRDWCEGKRKRK